MLNRKEAKARILSLVLDFLQRHRWRDLDDFSLRFADKVAVCAYEGHLPRSCVLLATQVRTNFFVVNHQLKRERFCDLFMRELAGYLEDIGISTGPGALTLVDIFPEVKLVSAEDAEQLLPKLRIDERIIQDNLRMALRERGATNMVSRKSESSLEVADLEDFTLKIQGRQLSFTAVVKGYNSVGPRIRLKDVSHQIMKAYHGTFPDYILFMIAKDPVDTVVSNLVRYGETVGNRDLVIIVDPIGTARFLHLRGVI